MVDAVTVYLAVTGALLLVALAVGPRALARIFQEAGERRRKRHWGEIERYTKYPVYDRDPPDPDADGAAQSIYPRAARKTRRGSRSTPSARRRWGRRKTKIGRAKARFVRLVATVSRLTPSLAPPSERLCSTARPSAPSRGSPPTRLPHDSRVRASLRPMRDHPLLPTLLALTAAAVVVWSAADGPRGPQTAGATVAVAYGSHLLIDLITPEAIPPLSPLLVQIVHVAI